MESLRDAEILDSIPVDSGDVGRGLEHGEHVWLYCRGRHYDSEAPQGVEDWRDLPFFVRFYTKKEKRIRRRESRAYEREKLENGARLMERVVVNLLREHADCREKTA